MYSRGGGIRNKHRKDCILCRNMSASTPAFGWLIHPMSGANIGICFKHVVSLCRSPKHAQTDGCEYDTQDSWNLLKMGGRSRWMPMRWEEFQLKSSGWGNRLQDNGQRVWVWHGLTECRYCQAFGPKCDHSNWTLVTGTHGKLPRPPKSYKDLKIVYPFVEETVPHKKPTG